MAARYTTLVIDTDTGRDGSNLILENLISIVKVQSNRMWSRDKSNSNLMSH
jgi:hypothetical protein